MLAVYHLATRQCPLKDLLGIPDLLDHAGIMDVPKARVVVLDGTARAPGQAWKNGKQTINTLWGELAWQLGGDEGYALVKEADTTGTSPGKNVLKTLLETYAPCVVLVDELVAYIRQFPNGQSVERWQLRQQSFVCAGADRSYQAGAERHHAGVFTGI